eukprot:1171057-Pleurochrysis_carterae.AAC.1
MSRMSVAPPMRHPFPPKSLGSIPAAAAMALTIPCASPPTTMETLRRHPRRAASGWACRRFAPRAEPAAPARPT